MITYLELNQVYILYDIVKDKNKNNKSDTELGLARQHLIQFIMFVIDGVSKEHKKRNENK